MNSKYRIILINGEKITIEAYSVKIENNRITFCNKNKVIVAVFLVENIVGFYEIG